LSIVEIKIESLHKSFGDNAVLQGIDLELYQREVIAIVGGSGCGKTVLLNHILRQLIPDSGCVRVRDHSDPAEPLVDLHEVGEFELEKIFQHWGVVFQRNALFSTTVFENIALWLREVKGLEEESILPIARRSLESVGLGSDDTFLEQPSEKLSGGMAKRLAVARAIAMDPAVIYYDEPTTGLDPSSCAQIHNLIYEMHYAVEHRTTVIITHDKDLLQRLRPRTIMLHEGKVFFDGAFEDFEASRSEIIRPYFDLMPLLQKRRIESVLIPVEERKRARF
jgi:phospholipid/cholesterol/gamma-HCH transport system ATP-binding protein